MRICAFCGEKFKGKTKDHVPPRNLFGNVPEGNLTTVPACKACNEGASQDDEVFRLLALENEASKIPAAVDVAESVYRSFSIPEKQGFRNYLFDRMEACEPIPSDDSKEVVEMIMKLPAERLHRTATKVIRGLFYKIRKHPVPANYHAQSYLLDVYVPTLPIARQLELYNLIRKHFLSRHPVSVGGEVFHYWSAPLNDVNPRACYALYPWEIWLSRSGADSRRRFLTSGKP